jgi:hypothetical protein
MSDTQTYAHAQAQSVFLSLPTELILEIIAHLDGDRKTLCNLAQTCRIVHPFCEKHIYADIELVSTDDLSDICYAFSKRRERIEAVQSLKILYKYHDGIANTLKERMVFNDCIRRMKALRAWHIESPFDNFKWGDAGGAEWVHTDMEVFRRSLARRSMFNGNSQEHEVALARLEKCLQKAALFNTILG